MKKIRPVYIVILFVLALSIVGLLYFRKLHAFHSAQDSGRRSAFAALSPARGDQTADVPPVLGAADPDQNQDVALNVTSFLGTLSPGGSAEVAGQKRTYVVTYQVAFFRKAPSAKVAEESLSYKELQERDPSAMPPYVYYGENVTGSYDPAHPESIAVSARVDRKQEDGYIDAGKLWLEPRLQAADSARYMALKDATTVYVVPDTSTAPVLTLLQGEVVDTVARLDFNGRSWIKAKFNAKERPRYGFIAADGVKALTAASVNPSAINVDEVPGRIRHSTLSLSDTDRQRLSQTGFYVEGIPPQKEPSVDDMADAYQEGSSQLFVTSDLYLHSFHLIFDRMLQDVEEKKLSPAVAQMAKDLAQVTENDLRMAPQSAPQLRQALLEDLFYFSVAARLFNPGFAVPDAVKTQAEPVISRIEAGQGELPSQVNYLGPDKEDFSQYKVRGHYQKNDVLKRYFRGMMWFGRHNFRLSEKQSTLAAIVIPTLVEEAHAARTFGTVDALLTYLIGRQDKYTLAGYRAVNRRVFGTETPSFRELSGNPDEKIAAFQKLTPSMLPPPQIVSVQTRLPGGPAQTQEERLQMVTGLKFLGQRYVLDAYILNQLTSPNVGTDDNPRNLPSALDVMMLLGSKAATDLQLQEQKASRWANYESQIAKLKEPAEKQLAKRSTFYDQWLCTLKALFAPTGSKQLFAIREPWHYKNLNTGLASWTELKHDTILYAEQSAAEMGEGDEFSIPPYGAPGPKGYVEPNPAFFTQLTQAVDRVLAQLKNSGFATDEYVDKLTLFRELSRRAAAIAQKEVVGETIVPDDYEWIANQRWAFDRTLLLPRDIDTIPDPSYLQMALVADVATDGFSGRVLEEGIGTPQKIMVVVKDVSGGTRLTTGYVYSWYEFPSGRRWSDTEWKQMVYSAGGAELPSEIKTPAWYSVLLKNGAQ